MTVYAYIFFFWSEWLDGYQYITEAYLLYLPTWGIFSLITFSKLLNSSVPQFLIYKMGIITVPTWKKVGIIQDLINPKAVVKTIVLSQQWCNSYVESQKKDRVIGGIVS